MEDFLHATPDGEGIDPIKSAFYQDPIKAGRSIMSRAGVLLAEGNAEEALQRATAAVNDIIASLIRATLAFEEELPAKQSVFRGGEDSINTYRTFCSLMSRLDACRASLREQVGVLSQLRDQSTARFAKWFSVKTELDVALRLSLPHNIIQSLTEIRKTVAVEVDRARAEVDSAKRAIERIRGVDQSLIRRFIAVSANKADSVNGGKNCDRVAISALVSELRRELAHI